MFKISKYSFLLIVFLLLLSSRLSAQQVRIDSLLHIIQTTDRDTTKVNALNKLASTIDRNQTNRALKYSRQALEIAKDIDYEVGRADAYYTLSRCYIYKRKYDSCLYFSNLSAQLCRQLGEELKLSRSFNIMGLVKYNIGRYDSATYYYNKCKFIQEKNDAKLDLAKTWNNFGLLYKKKGNLDSSIIAYNKAIEIYNLLGNTGKIAGSYLNMAYVHKMKGNYLQAYNLYQKSLGYYLKNEDKLGAAKVYNNLSLIFANQGDYQKALEYVFLALKLKKEVKDEKGKGVSYFTISEFYIAIEDFKGAIDYLNKSLATFQKINATHYVSECYLLFSEIYVNLDSIDLASKYARLALAKFKKSKAKRGEAIAYSKLANINKHIEKYDSAYFFLNKSMQMYTEIGDKFSVSLAHSQLGELYFAQKQFSKAIKHLNLAFDMGKMISHFEAQKKSSGILYQIYQQQHKYKKALHYALSYNTLSDSILSKENIKLMTQKNMQFQFEKLQDEQKEAQHKKDLLQQKEAQKQYFYLLGSVLGFFSISIIAFLIFLGYRRKEKANQILTDYNIEILQQKEEIQSIADNLTAANAEIGRKNKKITSSIQYAQKIQTALLPSDIQAAKILPEHFILFKPKDIVSGDFYYLKKIKEKLVVAAADCTGHGVPGAFVSMLGIAFLNEIIGKGGIKTASQILEELRKQVKVSLHQTGEESEPKDGMDIALCLIDTESQILQFAGANRPLYLIRNNELMDLKGTKNPIGIYPHEKAYENTDIQLIKGDLIYLFSDGYADQFGGKNEMKFMTKKLKNLLLSIHKNTLAEQKNILNETLETWQGNNEQVDDILLIGIKI